MSRTWRSLAANCSIRRAFSAAASERLAYEDRLLGEPLHHRVQHVEVVFEHLENVLELDLLAAIGHELLQVAEGVAERAGGRAGDHVDRRLGDRDVLLDRDSLQHA